MIAMLLVKATLVVGFAALVLVLAGRRASAAARHWVWTLAVLSLLALPLAARVLPRWSMPVPAVSLFGPADAPHGTQATAAASAGEPTALPETAVTAADAPDATANSSAQSSRWPGILFALYVSGAALLALRLAGQQLAARTLLATAEHVTSFDWIALLRECAGTLGVTRPVGLRRAAGAVMPMATGLRRPVILIPACADEWTAERKRAVLLHELAHIARHDCLTQLLAAVACSAYWVHPGVWWAARRLRVERELACDDLVLRAGTEARDYAGHLLEIAYSLGGHRAPAVAVSMARPGQLEGRMLAVLDAARNRAIPGLRGRLAGIAVAAAIVVPLATAAATSLPLAIEGEFSASGGAPILDANGGAPIAANIPNGEAASPDAAQEDASAARGAGTWEIQPAKASPGTVYLQMREGRSSSGTTIPMSRLDGLTGDQMSGSGRAVRFALRRDAGTFAFEGTFRSGVGGGTYAFTPNPAFPQELQRRGVGTPSADEQRDMAIHDVGLALVDELAAHGYARPTVADLIKAGRHGVRLDFVREMAQLGYRLGTVENLVRLRDHGVTPDYVRGMAAEGLPKMSADELVTTRDHGVTPEYARQMRQLGYGTLGVEALVRARDHGVTPEYVKALAEFGYTTLTMEQVINARDHGVTPDFVRGLASLGHADLTLEQAVNARDHGVTTEYASEMKALGYQAPLADLVRARDHGVTPDFARGLKALGYEHIPLDELIRLRDHGVTPERAKRANERAGTRLPPDMLRSLASRGGL